MTSSENSSNNRPVYLSSIPIDKVEKILEQVNAYPRTEERPPFPDLKLATERFIAAIEGHNDTVETLHNNETLTPRNQKAFYKKLETRLTNLIDYLEAGPYEYHERLFVAQANARRYENQPAEDDLFADRTGAEAMVPQKFINTLKAYRATAKDLEENPINQGRKDAHRDDLKQLIHFLFGMYQRCSGRAPGYNYAQRDGEAFRYEGDFILLVEQAIPFAQLNNKNGITNNSIGEGVKSVRKERT